MIKQVFVVFFIFYVIFVQSNPASRCGKKNRVQGNVLGGNSTKPNTWPWIVAFLHRVKTKKTFFCGGSLVSAKHVVSAAHCFQGKGRPTLKYPQDVTALIGVHNLTDAIEVASAAHKVWQVILHENWDWNSDEYDADISLVVLQTAVDLSDLLKVGIVCLSPASERDYARVGTVVGWGISEDSEANREHFDSTPNEIRLPAVTRSQCEEAGDYFIATSSSRTFCAGFLMRGKSACGGDSGGGFVAYNRLAKNYNLVGIVSSSPIYKNLSSCNINTYSIFTDVGKFVDWFRKNMKKTENIKWKNIKLNCSFASWDATCNNKFTGPMTRNLKIQESLKAVEMIVLQINFKPSNYIFAGLGENFPNLAILIIAKQPLKFVERENFFGLQKLQQLSLYENEIEILPEDLFWDLPNLRKLHLSNNQIMAIPEKLFINLRDIDDLSFDRNQIKSLSPNLFLNNLRIEWLYTYNNHQLTTNDVDFSGISNVRLYNETSNNHYQKGKLVNY